MIVLQHRRPKVAPAHLHTVVWARNWDDTDAAGFPEVARCTSCGMVRYADVVTL